MIARFGPVQVVPRSQSGIVLVQLAVVSSYASEVAQKDAHKGHCHSPGQWVWHEENGDCNEEQ